MSATTMLMLANGRNVDLLAPEFLPIDFAALAEMLAKEKRYNGATPGIEYSVAEHCCLGADAILGCCDVGAGAARQLETVAAYFLMHDLAEAIWKDDTTPKKVAISERIAARCGVTSAAILSELDQISDDHDAALHVAAGLAWPPAPEIQIAVKALDKVMFVTEWRDLMGNRPHPAWHLYEDVKPLKNTIARHSWTWNIAKRAWLRRAGQLLPSLRSSP